MAGPYDNSGLFERMLSIPRRGGFHTATKGTANTHIDFAPPRVRKHAAGDVNQHRSSLGRGFNKN